MTLPLVSYGGKLSSEYHDHVGIIQGLYIIREDEEEERMKEKERES